MKLPNSASTPARPPRSANSHRGPSMNSAFPNSLRAEQGRALGGLVARTSPQAESSAPKLILLQEALDKQKPLSALHSVFPCALYNPIIDRMILR